MEKTIVPDPCMRELQYKSYLCNGLMSSIDFDLVNVLHSLLSDSDIVLAVGEPLRATNMPNGGLTVEVFRLLDACIEVDKVIWRAEASKLITRASARIK